MPGSRRNLKPQDLAILDDTAERSGLGIDIAKQLNDFFTGISGNIGDLLTQQITRFQREYQGVNRDPNQSRIDRNLGTANLAAARGLTGQIGDLQAGQERLSNDILRGRTASNADLRQINELTNRALRSGQEDIRRFRDEGFEAIKTTIAPSRGLRPTDSPILDRFDDVASESLRQFGQLTQGLRGQEAQLGLQYPLQRRAADLAGLALESDLFSQQQNFAQGLSSQAFQNRLLLMGALQDTGFNLAQFGQGLSTGGAASIGAALPSLRGGAGHAPTPSGGGGVLGSIGGIAGGLGGLLGGAGQAGLIGTAASGALLS